MKKSLLRYIACLCLFSMSGCSTVSDPKEDQSALESYNHAMFNFNNKVEKAVIRPVAKGYRAITNDYIRQRVTNFFNNISEPVSAANHLLQGEWHNAAQNVSRLMINTTIGGLGLYDVAAKAGLEQKPTGFDETMAAWCVPDGPYIVLPLIGPSTPRAATGWVADGYSSPAYWVASESDGEDAMLVYYGANGLKYLNKYATNLKLLEGLEESAVDYYETVKAIYLQNRGKIKTCGKVSAENTPDYDFDMDSED